MQEISYFSSDYNSIKIQLIALLEEEHDFISNSANFASLLFYSLNDINWVGFYLLKDNELVLGPFQGKPACGRIAIGKGVCGRAAENIEIIIVENVHQFPGHIACDSASNSEIVIPLIKNNIFIGILDIDSPLFNRFGNEDANELKELCDILINNSEIEEIIHYCPSKNI
jgi:L-methionine (R)-S-oxide reductase